ncbi:hypothetical protein PMIN07_010812 [Paraphaeosphaeria minitans]
MVYVTIPGPIVTAKPSISRNHDEFCAITGTYARTAATTWQFFCDALIIGGTVAICSAGCVERNDFASSIIVSPTAALFNP